CRGAGAEARIPNCSEIFAFGNRETKSNQIAAYVNRASANMAKGNLYQALADLDTPQSKISWRPYLVGNRLARVPIVEEDALYAALKHRRLGGAAIDCGGNIVLPPSQIGVRRGNRSTNCPTC